MSAIVIRNAESVLLRYEVDVRGPQHDQSKGRSSDRLGCALLRSERQISYMRIMLEALEDALSAAALDRFEQALRTIEATLNLVREDLASGHPK